MVHAAFKHLTLTLCVSRHISHLAALFIDTRTKRSLADSFKLNNNNNIGRKRSIVHTTRTAGFTNDPPAGSPTGTLLRLLLPLDDQVRYPSRHVNVNPGASLSRPIGNSDGRCVQEAGT